MPSITRRQVLDNNRSNIVANTSDGLPDHDIHPPDMNELNAEPGDEVDICEQQEDEVDKPFPPPGLKEISSLASWTVSTAKPGSGVSALRSPDLAQFWQSDGPQPHLLTIHFFKLVPIVLMRIFLDFENDESYTPTKIQFLAGMGAHDLQEFAEMEFEQPTGWIEVDFTNVGPVLDDDEEEEEEEEEDDDDGDDDASTDESDDIDWSKRPTLRAMLVQVKILENHQNGKDTHLRGVQIFARDDTQQDRKQCKVEGRLSSVLAYRGNIKGQRIMHSNNIKLASWMQEPDLR